jgi:abortive infection bacteriophage resistance protein
MLRSGGMMVYNRPWKSFASQLELLKSRGMVVTDETAAQSYLERVGYYRLSAYWYPFRVFNLVQDAATQRIASIRTDQFEIGTQFVDAVELYLFDKKLRLLVSDALERIEIALRVDIAYVLGEYDTFAHQNQNCLHPTFSGKIDRSTGKTAFALWQEKYQSLLSRSKEDFVEHYREKHGPNLPIWVAVEILDFGAVSKLLAMMKVPDQQRIASKYGVNDWKVFSSWLRALNYLRNLAAHHSRLWNRNVIDQPKLPIVGTMDWCDSFVGKADLIAKPFLLLAITRHLVMRVCPNSHWPERVRELLISFPQQQSRRQLSVFDMGAPQCWETWWTKSSPKIITPA